MGTAPGLRLDQTTYDAMLAQCREEHPYEACGMVTGPDRESAARFVPMRNAAHSTTFYTYDSKDLLALYRDLDDREEVPVVIYHSHTASEAYPSARDIALAGEPDAHYVVVSTRSEHRDDVRSFQIVDGLVTEEPIEIVPSAPDPHIR